MGNAELVPQLEHRTQVQRVLLELAPVHVAHRPTTVDPAYNNYDL